MTESNITAHEYYMERIETSRRALMNLLARVESPHGDILSEILVNCVNEIEALQEVKHETGGDN